MEEHIIGAGMVSYPAGLQLRVHVYRNNNRPALALICADDFLPYLDLTANVPDQELAEDEVFIAAWNVPNDVLTALLESGWFVPARTIATGYTRGPVWKIQSADLLAWIADAREDALADMLQ
ncbi:hypothetical protein PO002_38115 [Cupriavidus necator]|uniref:hypothetical protein n=1 Tax=Cupriavidus necator TaxID=106590 RepID=UPI0039C261D3